MRGTRIRSRRGLGLLLAAGLLLTACNGDTDPTGEESEPAEETEAPAEDESEPEAEPEDDAEGEEQAAPEVTDINIGLIPIADVAPVPHALAQGYFEEEGLDVTLEYGVGGAALVPALIAGDIQVGFGNYVSHILAINEGFDLSIISEGPRAVPGFSGVFAMPDSGLSAAADLEGATVSTNTLNNVGPLAINAVLDAEGADADAIEYTEVPFPEAAPTLERGDIDAAWVVEPFTTLIQDQIGAEAVIDPFSGPTDGLAIAGYAVTAEFAASNPNTVAALQRAIQRATDDLQDDATAREAIAGYTELDQAILDAITLPGFVSEVDPAEIQRVADLMIEYGLIEDGFDVTEYIH
ncbi:MAG TPA: ABC transporter substrate-binding protein [Egicoccus sp.]|nr:ABC transporter substrate-binding protein [Egicoccus sp.]HSK25119.1 ABC transporter substrate-binding protein [Egicoccus sp.]